MTRWTLAGFWLLAGSMHFIRPRFYDAIVPPPLDRHARAVTYASGVAELAGAVAVAAGARRFARWWLLAVIAGVYPANVWMALEPDRFPQVPRWALYMRLPVQFLFAWHAWKGTAGPAGSWTGSGSL
jgi:uncharacterized membrane protein